MRLIDADALIPLIKMGECNMYDEYCQGRNGGIEFAVKQVKQMPTIEPKKGKWVKEDSIYETVTCSVCHGVRRDNRVNHVKFCNCCGARMEDE